MGALVIEVFRMGDGKLVGAEISGPALPRFTSGEAAARLAREETLHERLHGGLCEFQFQRELRAASQGGIDLLSGLLNAHSRLHDCCALGCRASSAPQHKRALINMTCRPPGSTIVHLPRRAAMGSIPHCVRRVRNARGSQACSLLGQHCAASHPLTAKSNAPLRRRRHVQWRGKHLQTSRDRHSAACKCKPFFLKLGACCQ
jgi:hypothetical protein